MVLVSVSASFAGTVAVTGVINTLVMRNIVRALVQPSANITATGTELYTVSEDGESEELCSGDVDVDADDDSFIINLAGSLSAAGTVGVGATIVALVFSKTVTADVSALAVINAGGSIFVRANGNDELFLLAIAFGAAGTAGVAGGANALVFTNVVTAALGGTANAQRGVLVAAGTDSLLVNAALAVGVGGTAGVTAIAVITYFYNQTLSYIHADAEITAVTGDIKIAANSSEFVTADAAGAAVGGTAGVGGTLDILITKVVTKAYTESSVKLTAGGDIRIDAEDDYGLVAVVVSIGAAGVAGVGVSLLLSLSFNTVEASIGASNEAVAGGSVLVTANSSRDVLSIVTSVGGGGVAGVGVSLSVVVTGNKISQDVHDGIYASQAQEQYEHDGKVYYVYLDEDNNRLYEYTEGETSTLYRLNGDVMEPANYSGEKTAVMTDIDTMDPQQQVDDIFANANPHATSGKPGESLTDLLQGDGQNTSDLDPDSSSYGQSDDGSEDAMNDDTYDQTVDGSAVHSSRIGDLSDSTSAMVYASAAVTANGGNIEITSSDRVNANMIAGTFGVGAYAGVGVGLAVSVLFSNVNAMVESGAVLSAPNGTVKVSASTGSEAKDIENINDDTQSVNDKVADLIFDTDTSTIRLISVTGGGGLVGVGVTIAVLLVFTEVNAVIAGNVAAARNVEVHAGVDFGQVITGTLAVSGGFVGVAVSGAVTYFQATAMSAIAGTANISNVTGNIKVTTNGCTNAIAAASSIAGGAVAVNAGMALTINRTRVDTFIGQGVTIDSPSADVLVKTTYIANASAFTIGVSVGGVAVGATLAIVINLLDAYTYIGLTPSGTPVAGSSAATAGSIKASGVNISSDVAGVTTVFGIGVSGGAVAVNGIVALGFNRAVGCAALYRANVEAGSITITSVLSGDTTVTTTGLVLGGVAVGATVALAQIKSVNRAMLDATGSVVKANSISVNAGTASNPYNSQAIVTVVTGTAGAASIALNFAVAINASTNTAAVQGVGGTIDAVNLSVYAEGNTRAYAIIANASVGGLVVNISVAIALLSSVQEALVTGSAAITLTGWLNVTSRQNTTLSSYSTFLLQITDRLTDTVSGRFSAMAQAYIFSASAGVVSVKANVVTATANATGRAKVDAANLNVAGTLSVYSYGKSTASAKVDNITFAYASAGLMCGYAYAEGTFEAALLTSGEIHAGNIYVITSFTSDATSDLTPAAAGLQAGVYDVGANISLAESKSTVKAYISGSGSIIAAAVKVSSGGNATAYAVVRGVAISVSGVKVALNESYAKVTAVQDAYIKNVSLMADSVEVSTSLNNSNETGAVAEVGSTGSKPNISISFVNGTASFAQALVTATSRAYISGAALAVSGAVSVTTTARSYANADILTSQYAISVLNVSLLVTYAYARGTFQAYIDSTGATMLTGSLSISTTYYATAYAATGAAGGVGVSLADINSNEAFAANNVSASSSLRGSGSMTVSGSINILTEGYACSSATGRTHDFSVSALEVAVNYVEARLNISQSAYINTTGSITALGSVNVNSEIFNTGDFGKAEASVGGSGAGAHLSLIGVTVNEARSYATSVNSAYIRGSGSITAYALTIKAKTITASNATAKKSLSVSLLTVGSLRAVATTGDAVSAYVYGTDIQTTNGDVGITAIGNTTAYAFCEEAGGIGLVSGSSTKAETYLGTSDSRQTVSAGIGGGANVEAAGNATIRAYNSGSASSVVQKGTTAALIAVSESKLPTSSYYSTSAYVNGNSSVTAGGSISVKSEDYTKATSNATATQIGFGVNAGSMYGSNTISVLNAIDITGALSAGSSLTVQAKSNADMYAKTYADGGGFFSGSTLKAVNDLTRSTTVGVGVNSSLYADFGDLLIEAVSGENDDIYTYSKISSGGVVALGDAEATTDVDSSSLVTIGAGVSIQDRFNTVNIYSNASIDSFVAKVEVNTSGLGVRPYSYANTDVDLVSKVTIAGSSGSLASIEGRYVNIKSMIGELYVYTYTYANGKALGADVDAKTDMDIYITSETKVSYASITGHDNTYIAASSKPAYRSANIYGVATARLNAIGEAVARVDINGKITTTTAIQSGVKLIGAKIVVTKATYDNDRTEDKRNTSGFIVKKKRGSEDLEFESSAAVANGTELHLGDAAGGIFIDISGSENNYTVRQVGLKNETSIWTITGESILFTQISNALPGQALLYADIGTLKIFDQSYIPEVTITNRTGLNVVLSGITVQNTNFIKPTVRGENGFPVSLPSSYGTSDGITLSKSAVTSPSITVTNEQDGGLRINGLISNSGGAVSFLWTGETGGALTAVQEVTSISAGANVSPIWAAALTITNAGSIGAASYEVGETTVTQSVNAYLFNTSGGASYVNISAQGDIYMMLTAAELVLLSSSEWSSSPWEGEDASDGAGVDMRMVSIVSDTGDIEIDLPQGIRVYQLANTNTISMPVPGTLEYIVDALATLSQNVTITGIDALNYYLVSYNPVNDLYCFELPNGTYLYTDSLGNVARITEGGVDFAVSDYEFTTNDEGEVTSITLAAGVSIDLATGKLTVDEDCSYEVLLSAVSGEWLYTNIHNSAGSIDLVISTTTVVLSNEGVPEYTSTDSVVSLVYWWSYGTLTYYYASGLRPQIDESGTYYLIAYDTSDDTFAAYLLEGSVTITSGTSNDTVKSYNLMTDDDGPHTVTMTSGTTYYEIIKDNYNGSVIDTSVSRANKVFGISGLASTTITYDYNARVWYCGGNVLDIKSVNGIYYVPDNYSVSGNDALNAVYESLKGKYWTMSLESTVRESSGSWEAHDDGRFYFAVFAYEKDDTNYYWVSNTALYSYYLNINCTTAVPLSLMLTANESKEQNEGTSNPQKDYILTFGTPVCETTYTAEYKDYVYENGAWVLKTLTATEQGYAEAVLNIQGRIEDIPIKAVNEIPENNMVSSVSGYRVTETLYVTTTGIAVMINENIQIGGKAFAAKYDGNEYHSDYLNATQLGKVSKYNSLAVDEDGYVIYTDANGYIYRLEGDAFVYTGTRAGVEDITGESAIELIQDGFFLDAVVDGDGNITGYETDAGVSLTQNEALQIFNLGGTGTFKDADGNIYFFESGKLICRRAGVSDISGTATKDWLLANADYACTADNGVTYIFSRDLTELDALKLVYGVDETNPTYIDGEGNVYLLDGNELVYQGAPADTLITGDEALESLRGMIVGYSLNGKNFVFVDGTAITGGEAAYLLYEQISDDYGTYFKIDETDNRYTVDADGNLVYESTELPDDMAQTYGEATLPEGSEVLTQDGEGNALTVSVGGYIYNVIRTSVTVGEVTTTVTTYEYSGKMADIVVTQISADDMIGEVEDTAARLYDAEDLSKTFAVDITGAGALALLYPMENDLYTDADGYIFALDGGDLSYTGAKEGVVQKIYGSIVRAELLDGRDSYYYNGAFFTTFVTEENALRIYYNIENDVYDSGDNMYVLSGSDLIYIGSAVDLTPADTDAYKSLQALKDGEGNVTGYTHDGAAVSAETALKLFKLLGTGTFKDADGNVYSFVNGEIIRTEPGVTMETITGQSAIEWLMDHASGYYYERDGVAYTFDDSITAEEALQIRYNLTLGDDEEWYYTDTNGNVYRLESGNLVYVGTPALLYNITSADALIVLDGMVIGYKSGEKIVYLETDGTITDENVAGFLFDKDGEGYYVDEDGNRYSFVYITPEEGDEYCALQYYDSPEDLPDLDSRDDLVRVIIPDDPRTLYRDDIGRLYEEVSSTQYSYTGKKYALDDTYVTVFYLLSELEQQILDTSDRVYEQNGEEKTFTAAQDNKTYSLYFVYGVDAENPYYIDDDGYIYQLNEAGNALVYTGMKDNVSPLLISGEETRTWLLNNYDGWVALGRYFEVTPVVDSVTGLPTGEHEFAGTAADALRLVYEMGDADVYTDMNGNVFKLVGDELIYAGTLYAVDDLTEAEALDWIYHLDNGKYTDEDSNVFMLIGGNLVYEGTPVTLADITGDAFDAIYYEYKAVENAGAAFEMTVNKEVYLERLTDVIATDAAGNYYYYDGASWTEVTGINVASSQHSDTRETPIYAEDGITQIGTKTEQLMVYRDTVTHTGGVTVVERTYVQDDESGEWLRDSVMIRLPNLTKVYSDGRVEPASENALTMHIVTVSGVVYYVDYIEATLGSISMTMHDYSGSLLDGNGPALNMKAGSNIDFYLRTTGSVGTPDKLLDVSAGQKVMVYDITGELGLVSSSIYLFVPAAEGSITLEENTRIINGATYHVVTENGDILGNRVEVIAGNLILDANSNGTNPEITGAVRIATLIVRYDADQDAINDEDKVYASTADIDAMGDIELGAFTAHDGSTVTLTSTGGGLSSNTWDVDDSIVTADVYGEIAIGVASITGGSTVGLTSTNGGLTSDAWTVTASDVTASVYGDIAIGTAGITAGSTVGLTSTNGGLTSDSWTVNASDVTAGVYGDIAIGTASITAGSTVGLTSTNGGLTSDTWTVDDSDVTAHVYGDIAIGEASATGGSTIDLTSTNGGLTSSTWLADASSVTALVYGDIEITGAEVKNGSTVDLTSTGGGLTSDVWTVNDSDVTAFVYDDIEITVAEIKNGSTVDLTSTNGGLTSNGWAVNDSDVTAFVYGDIEITDAEIKNGSTVRLTSTDGGLTSNGWAVNDSEIIANIYGGVSIGTGEAIDSAVTLYAKAGGLSMEELYLRNSTWQASVFGDAQIPQIETHGSDLTLLSTDGSILFNAITASDSNVSLLAYKDAGLLDNTLAYPIISFAKDDTPAEASLTLSAEYGDIGSALKRLQIDIPAEITVRINAVSSYYIDAVDLPLSVDPFYAVYGGWDGTADDSEYLAGVYLKYSDEQFFEILLNADTPEELSAWISQRASGRTYLESIDSAALWAAVHDAATGDTDPAALSALLGEILGEEFYAAMAGEEPSILTQSDLFDALVNALREQQTTETGGATELAYVIGDADAQAILAALLDADLLSSLGELLGQLLTAEDIEELYLRAKQASTTPEDTCVDEPARAFNLSVGRSTGMADVTNEGSITIEQDLGDATLGVILSVRGDVSISAYAGSILAASADTLVTGWDIAFSADGDVGTAALPININQRANRPMRLVNVDEEIYTADKTPRGQTAFGTEFGVRFDPDGAGTPSAPVIVAFGASSIPDDTALYVLEQIELTDADGAPLLDEEGNPLTGWALKVAVRYDWLRITFNEESTTLNVTASQGGIHIDEQSGDLGIGVLSARDDIVLSTPGSIVDVRTETQTAAGERNLTAGGDVGLTAVGGSLGASAQEALLISVGGVITAACEGGAYLTAESNLDLDLTCQSGDIALNATGRVGLVSHAPATLIGSVYAGYGVSIDAAGGIGTSAAAMIIDANRSGAGTLALSGGNVYVSELAGDVFLEKLYAAGDAVLTVQGSLYDANPNGELWQIIQNVTNAQLEADALKNDADAAQARVDVLTEYIARQALLLLEKAAVRDAVQTTLDAADTALAQAQGSLAAAQAALAALMLNPDATPDQIAQAEALVRSAVDEVAGASADYAEVAEKLAAAQAEVDAVQLLIDGANTLIAAEDLAVKLAAYEAAQARLTREKALLDAQIGVNDAQDALDAAQANYDESIADSGTSTQQIDAAALALRRAQGALEAARYLLSIQKAINDASDVLADAGAGAAEKLAAQTTLANANLAYAEAQSLIEKYEDTSLDGEALDIADALLEAQKELRAAQDAYAFDPSAENLSLLEQAEDTLQAAKDSLGALDEYLQAKEVSEAAQDLEAQVQQAQADADAAQAVLDAYAVLAAHGSTAEEKAAAQALITASGMTEKQAQQALESAETEKTAAQDKLDALLAENGYTSVQEAVDAETAARAALGAAETIRNTHNETNDAWQAVLDARQRLSDANSTYGEVDSLLSARAAAQTALDTAQLAMDGAYQNWVDARLAAGSDADAAVIAALNEYLAAQDERDEKQADLAQIDGKLALLPSKEAAQTEINDAGDALDLAQQAHAAKLAAQPAVIADSFGGDFIADDEVGAKMPTVRTGGDLTVTTGGNAGTPAQPLSVAVDGVIHVSAGAGGTVALASAQGMDVGGITGESVELTAYGDIMDQTPEGGFMIEADSAILYAIGGIIGGSYAKLNVNKLSAFADEIYIKNFSALELGTIAVHGSTGAIVAGGAITQQPGGYVAGSNITLIANGDIGTETTPITTNVENLTASGSNVYINSIGHLQSVKISGGSAMLTVGGSLMGGSIHASSLSISAFGNIGSAGSPLRVWIPGKVILSSEYGLIYVVNLLIKTTILLGLRLAGDGQAGSSMMLYILIGVDMDGNVHVLSVSIGQVGDAAALDEIAAYLAERSLPPLSLALIDGLGDAGDAYVSAFAECFPEAQVLATDNFWIVSMREQIDASDWDALIDGLQSVYGAVTAEAMQTAAARFTERWQAKYPDVTERLNGQLADTDSLLAASEAMRDGGVLYGQLVDCLTQLIDELDQSTTGGESNAA